MNNGTFAGYLGRDPELREINGEPVLNMSVAVEEYRGRDVEPDTMWVDVSVWGRRGEALAKFLRKGAYVVATGRVGLNVFQRRDGSAGASLKLKAYDVEVGPRSGSANDDRRDSSSSTSVRPPAAPATAAPSRGKPRDMPGSSGDGGFSDDEIPF